MTQVKSWLCAEGHAYATEASLTLPVFLLTLYATCVKEGL